MGIKFSAFKALRRDLHLLRFILPFVTEGLYQGHTEKDHDHGKGESRGDNHLLQGLDSSRYEEDGGGRGLNNPPEYLSCGRRFDVSPGGHDGQDIGGGIGRRDEKDGQEEHGSY